MGKQLRVLDSDSGEVLEDIRFSGGYNIQYASNEDGGRIQYISKLNNGKFGEKHWIKNVFYEPIAVRLINKFKEINHVKANEILFLEDQNWKPSAALHPWMAITRKTNKQFAEMTGYKFIIETREWFTERMSNEKLILLIYHELRHIGEAENIVKHDVEDWNNIVATFGTDWTVTNTEIDDILSSGFDGWEVLKKDKKQITVYDIIGEHHNK